MTLHLRLDGDSALAVYLRGERVARIGSNRSEVIKRCMDAGYRYVGSVRVTRNGVVYAEFVRAT